jgi:hypothetical protein
LAVRPLALLGQASLQVFCVHLLFCFAGLTLLGNAATLSGWGQLALLATTLAAMLLTAKVFSKSEAKSEVKSDAAGNGHGERSSAPQVETAAAAPQRPMRPGIPLPAESKLAPSTK